MRGGTLELRSWTMVALGYVVAPIAGLTSLWGIYIFRWSNDPATDWSKSYAAWGLMIIIGGVFCLAVEVVFVTPILMAYRRYKWRWLNTWSASLIGFVLGFGTWLALGLADTNDWDTLKLVRVLHETGDMGVAGAVSAVVFRMIAVRPSPRSGLSDG